VANCAWAFAKLGHYNAAALDALAGAACDLLGPGGASPGGSEQAALQRRQQPGFGPQGLCNVLWALAKLGHHHGALLEAACAALPALLPRCALQDLQHAAWALAVLNHYSAHACERLAARACELQRASGPQAAPGFSAVWWGLAVLRHLDHAVWGGAARLLQGARPAQFKPDELCQLMQVWRRGVRAARAHPPPCLQHLQHAAWHGMSRRQYAPAPLHLTRGPSSRALTPPYLF
jgi:hypothetical protein